MEANSKIEVHLYGKLRRVAGCHDTASDCITWIDVSADSTIADVLAQLGIAQEDTSNIFLNAQLSLPSRGVKAGDRLGVFPNDMATLYKWYFTKTG